MTTGETAHEVLRTVLGPQALARTGIMNLAVLIWLAGGTYMGFELKYWHVKEKQKTKNTRISF